MARSSWSRRRDSSAMPTACSNWPSCMGEGSPTNHTRQAQPSREHLCLAEPGVPLGARHITGSNRLSSQRHKSQAMQLRLSCMQQHSGKRPASEATPEPCENRCNGRAPSSSAQTGARPQPRGGGLAAARPPPPPPPSPAPRCSCRCSGLQIRGGQQTAMVHKAVVQMPARGQAAAAASWQRRGKTGHSDRLAKQQASPLSSNKLNPCRRTGPGMPPIASLHTTNKHS